MKNLNQLVCVTLMLSCLQAYRSYISAQQANAPKTHQQLHLINGTDWNLIVRYTTPAGVITSDTVNPNGSKTIDVDTKDLVSYSLSKERAQTETRTLPIAMINQGTFQLTTDMIKDLIAPFVPAVVVPVAVPVATTAPHTPPTPPVITSVTMPQPTK